MAEATETTETAEPPREQPDPPAAFPPGPEEDELDTGHQRQGAQVINNFYKDVDARSAHFGISRSQIARRATGIVTVEQHDRALRYLVRTAAHGEALTKLRADGLVVLHGEEGSGKRAAAYDLLGFADCDPTGLRSLSPALTLTELADYEHFRQGRGYVVVDWAGDPGGGLSQRGFELERLSQSLKRTGAHLVLTTVSNGVAHQVQAHVVPWTGPDPAAVLDRCLEQGLAAGAGAEVLAQARARIADVRRPRDVVRVAELLDQGIAVAFELLDDVDQRNVSAFFDSVRDRHQALSMAALAFVHGIPERTFEELLAGLVTLAEPPGAAAAAGANEELPQRRAQWAGEHPLVRISTDLAELDGHPVGERRVVFTSTGHRELVIAELVHRYGFELWEPLRQWIHELSTRPVSEAHLQLSLGVALLARVNPREAEEYFLQPWARGAAPQRFAAAAVLSWMCNDESQAPLAMRIALSWAENAGTNAAMTAAVALGGELGVRYPSQAAHRLWQLGLRAERVRVIARNSLALLFSISVDGADHGRSMLTFVSRLAGGTLAEQGGGRSQSARHLLNAVLAAPRIDGAEPAVAALLCAHPDTAEVLGEFWALTLGSAPHRRAALEALRSLLIALDRRDRAQHHTAALGAAVRRCLSPAQVAVLHRDLAHAFARGEQVRRPLLAALLDAFRTIP